MKKMISFFVLLLFCGSNVLGSGFPSLKLGTDAQSTAMGLAGTAGMENGASCYWNPASLTFIKGKKLLFSYHSWIQDVKSQFIGFGYGLSKQGFGLYLLFTEVGGIEHRIVPTPDPLGTFSNHEMVMGLSYAHQIGQMLSLGLALKMYYQKLFIEESTGLGGDIGVLLELWKEGFRVGGVVQNIGNTAKLKDESTDLPLLMKVGIAVPFSVWNGRLTCVLDGILESNFPFYLHSGIEYGWQELLFLRLGYQTGYETRWITAGLGVGWQSYRLDYSYVPLRSGLGDSHRLSLGFEW
jgi:hypothetical protein